MSEARLEIKVGAISFTAEGSEGWITQQMEQLLEKLPLLIDVQKKNEGQSQNNENGAEQKSDTTPVTDQKTLAAFLKEKNATSKQARRFLATAAWLHNTGKSRLTT